MDANSADKPVCQFARGVWDQSSSGEASDFDEGLWGGRAIFHRKHRPSLFRWQLCRCY